MKVAITGGTGFIGRLLIERHLREGDEVRVLTRKNGIGIGLDERAVLFHGELGKQQDTFAPFLDGVDVLYHCAGEIVHEERMYATHVEGTKGLIAAASGSISHWVQLSSVGVYGPQRTGVVTETTPVNPVGTYETTKLQSDELVLDAAKEGKFSATILRPSNVYGTGMKNRSLLQMIRMIERGLFFYIGKPGATANYIHVDNVVEALYLCATNESARNNDYNLSDALSLEEFVRQISVSLGIEPPGIRFPEPPIRLGAALFGWIPGFPLTLSRVDALTGRAVYSSDKIEGELGYRHRISMEEGIREFVKNCRTASGNV